MGIKIVLRLSKSKNSSKDITTIIDRLAQAGKKKTKISLDKKIQLLNHEIKRGFDSELSEENPADFFESVCKRIAKK